MAGDLDAAGHALAHGRVALLGAGLAPRLGRRFGPARAMLVGLGAAALGAACVPLAGTGAGHAAWGAVAWLVAHQIVGDAGHALYDVHDRTLRQTAVPPALLARADAGIRSAGQLATLTTLAGAPVGGVLGTAFGARGVLWLVVAAQGAAFALVALRLRHLRALPASAAPSA